jgi:hypothetical protein
MFTIFACCRRGEAVELRASGGGKACRLGCAIGISLLRSLTVSYLYATFRWAKKNRYRPRRSQPFGDSDLRYGLEANEPAPLSRHSLNHYGNHIIDTAYHVTHQLVEAI